MAFNNPVMVMHKKANNGQEIGSKVVQVGEVGTKNCYRAEATVNNITMAHSHHDNPESAKAWAENMHGAYMEVHAKPDDNYDK